ncbi:hypothetical protein WJX72_000469 [[Myrmecia] bisecta]|uniref:Uncharacterized protein n=1 Tax=[Myrmecia] bisecta TaxID=41462 RepID=A0AAW1R3H0_9CHLO
MAAACTVRYLGLLFAVLAISNVYALRHLHLAEGNHTDDHGEHSHGLRRLQQAEFNHTHDHGDHSHDATIIGDYLWLDSVELAELKGVWYGLGDQIPKSVSLAYDTPNTVPDCSNHTNEYDYEHYNPYDDHFTTIYDHKGDIVRVSAGHKRTSYVQLTSYNSTSHLLQVMNPLTNVESCTHWKTYIDLRTGELKAESIGRNMWMKAADGRVIRMAATCTLTGEETPGCYIRSRSEVDGLVSAASVGTPTGDVIVEAVTKATYVCKNGECLAFAPKYNPEGEHAH